MTAAYCPDCGVPGDGQAGCMARYHHFLALEFTDPAFGALHHLTVLAYQLQHPGGIPAPVWLQMRALLGEFLLSEKSPQYLIRRERLRWQGGKRAGSAGSPPLELPKQFRWGRSIDSVDSSRAERYRQGVTLWARQVLDDAQRIADPQGALP